LNVKDNSDRDESAEGSVRLQKFIADAGICSRRSAEALIAQGEVWVNGKMAVLGTKVAPGVDRVTVGGKIVRTLPQPRITLAVNKPRGLICSNDDPHNPETIFMLLPREYSRFRFFCAGRLDKDSEGLVILTTDGDLANRLMHPSNEVMKRYHVTLKQSFPASRLPRLVKGLTFEGERLKVERAAIINPKPDGTGHDLDVHMHHGKKREIRLLFSALGYIVLRLRRYQIGAVRLKGIPLRGAKQLASKEIEQLFRSPKTPHAELQATAQTDHTLHED
jgi:23S rRNA pseudouridine2605 synthase